MGVYLNESLSLLAVVVAVYVLRSVARVRIIIIAQFYVLSTDKVTK